ncbi:MAG TPA: glutamate-cysteine ligase family protein [Candidatus Polarisedimenticolia bacterium]|nr:glutamate-cysteine ligase family protein [Candidatus Polarisedimenticolia bacterium]
MEATSDITREEDLQGYFDLGAKPRERWGIGLEYERVGLFRDSGRAVPYEGPLSVETLLQKLTRDKGWTPHEEGGRILSLTRESTNITLEPGGQIELSGAVHRTLAPMRDELANYLQETDEVSRPLGIAWLGLGLHPLTPLEEIRWIPKARYAIMRDYLPRRGRLAHVMMKQTACIQVNLDYASEADAADKMRTAMALSPLVTALYANSPLTEGRLNGYMSYRTMVWRDTDPDRCGLLPFVFKDGAGFADYLDYALDVPMFFVVRGDSWMPANGMTFRRFIKKGFEGQRPTLADFELHLTTLFPEVRLKRYIEVRGADSGDPASCLALAALWKGILYDGASRRAAWEMVREMTFKERDGLLEEIARLGPAAPLPGARAKAGAAQALVRDALIELVRLARQGLNNQGATADEAAYLDLLDRRLGGEGGCPGHRLAADWEGPLERNPQRLVEALAQGALAVT